jgi:RimJ/RimL family protein N-acetyltransferase
LRDWGSRELGVPNLLGIARRIPAERHRIRLAKAAEFATLSPMSFLKVAAREDQSKAASLLQSIYAEEPKLWPHGLTVDHFTPGNLWLVKKSNDEDPVGFVGWQTRMEQPYKVGYYAVGILPEHRNQGLATAAISALLEKKAQSVDRVKALIVEGNAASEHIADNLGVETVSHKQANGFTEALKFMGRLGPKVPASAIAKRWGATVGVPATMDMLTYGRDPDKSYFDQPWTAGRITNTLLNTIIGRWAAAASSPKKGFGLAMGAPIKDLTLQAIPAVEGINRMSHTLPDSVRAAGREMASSATNGASTAVNTVADTAKNLPLWALLSGAGLLTGGLAYGAHRLSNAIKEKAEAPINIRSSDGGRIKVTLPTRNPNDAETVLDLPFDQDKVFSNAQKARLGIDARRRIRAESTQRKLPAGVKHDLQVS